MRDYSKSQGEIFPLYTLHQQLFAQKTCGIRSRQECLYCKETFDSFRGVRTHEERVHKDIIQQTSVTQARRTEAEILRDMADLESKLAPNSQVLVVLSRATGLTKHQVRHRREKQAYKDLLELHKRKNKNLMASVFASTSAPNTNATANPDATHKNAKQSENTTPATPDKTPKRTAGNGTDANSSVSAIAENTNIAQRVGKRAREDDSPSEEPSTSRASKRPTPLCPQRKRLAITTEDHNIDSSMGVSPEQVPVNGELYKFLAEQMLGLTENDRKAGLGELIKIGLNPSPSDLESNIEN